VLVIVRCFFLSVHALFAAFSDYLDFLNKTVSRLIQFFFIRKSLNRFSRVWNASSGKAVGPGKESEDIWFGKLQGKVAQ
jgi:hypothetical protein